MHQTMVIKSGNKLSVVELYIHCIKLDIVNSFEYLGIHIDNGLVINTHVDSMPRVRSVGQI